METHQVNIALFIDFENFGSHRTLDIGGLTAELRSRGRLLIKRAYADWGRFSTQKRKMLEHAVDLTELPEHSNKGKNSADIRLVVDALEVALTMPHVDTFVVASSDSDYTPLFSKLRERGRTVIVAGTRADMNPLVKAHCDEVIYLEASTHAAKTAAGAVLPKATLRLFHKALDRSPTTPTLASPAFAGICKVCSSPASWTTRPLVNNMHFALRRQCKQRPPKADRALFGGRPRLRHHGGWCTLSNASQRQTVHLL